MSAVCPKRWTGMIAFVFRVMAVRTDAGFMLFVRSSMSEKTGFAPHQVIASAVAMKVFGTVTTSSPGPMPSAMRLSQRASVPFPTPTACLQPQNAAKSFSNFATKGPPAKAVFSMTSPMAAWISSLMVWYWAFRSKKGTFIFFPFQPFE
ncbi:MAG: hypothetical protein A4E68_00012 [Syntrophaceae bacterium PtaB.Bin095]|nr:MAG: hypothetical protein A4E68_00012 [Syntrophaceae bacterium PtaB.Bin095]